jgi:hypothetical protein
LTHLRDPRAALATWGTIAAPRARLLVHETETLRSDHAALARYYELVALLQAHYGQSTHIGSKLECCFADTPWSIADSRLIVLEKPARAMAELHLANVRTWRHDEFARRAFDAREVDELEAALGRIVAGDADAGVVQNGVRQIVAIRRNPS